MFSDNATNASAVLIGYGKNLEPYLPSEKQLFIELPKLLAEPDVPSQEATKCARGLYNKYKTSLNLCLSGGLDSEVMALACLDAEVPFYVSILKFKNNLNIFDIQHALNFCERNNIVFRVHELDAVDFLEKKRYREYFEKYNCLKVEIAIQLWFLEQIKKSVVLWGGEVFRALVGVENIFFSSPGETEAVFARFFNQNNIRGSSNFQCSSSGLIWSFLKRSLSLRHRLFEDDHDPRFYIEKRDFYKACGFQVSEAADRNQKLHGFEQLKQYFDDKLREDGLDYNKMYREEAQRRFPLRAQAQILMPDSDPIREAYLGF